jgi:hypothetical protein
MYLVLVVVENKPQVIAQVKTLDEAERIMDTQTRNMPTFAVNVPGVPENSTMDSVWTPKVEIVKE